MAATRVRLVAEFRNGDGHYLRSVFTPNGWTPCRGERDLDALESAFLVLIDHAKLTDKLLHETHKKPSHD